MLLENETLYVRSGSFMASTGDLDIDTNWGGATNMIVGTGHVVAFSQSVGYEVHMGGRVDKTILSGEAWWCI